MRLIHRIPFSAVLFAVLSLPVSAGAQTPATDTVPADTVRLRFGWTPGMRAQVEYEQVRVRSSDIGRDSVRLASTYRVEVEAHPEGLAVRYADMRWADPSVGGPVGEILRQAAEATSTGALRNVIGPEGDFLRVEGVEAVSAQLRQALQGTLSALDSAELAAEAVSSMLSEEALASAASDEWNSLVGAWLDADLAVGGFYELESSFQSPLFPGVELPVFMEFSVPGRVPCTAQDDGARCVELRMSSYPDREALAEAIGDFLERLGAPPQELEGVLAALAVESHVTLVTEPGTLRPHRLVHYKAVYAGEGEDGDPAQTDTQTYVFRYPE